MSQAEAEQVVGTIAELSLALLVVGVWLLTCFGLAGPQRGRILTANPSAVGRTISAVSGIGAVADPSRIAIGVPGGRLSWIPTIRAPDADMSAIAPRSRRPPTSISTGMRERQRGAARRGR